MDIQITSIDNYIVSCNPEIQPLLNKIRETIKRAAPDAVETIKYGMPTFILNGNLVHFAACKNHIGFYPTPSALIAFRKELSGYKGSKGAVRFPLDHPVPFELISKMTEFRVKENITKVLRNKKR